MTEPESREGLFASLRRLVGTAAEAVQVRLALLSNEIEQEKLRVFDSLLLGGSALIVLGVGILLLCGFIVMLFGEEHRLAALGVLSVLFLAVGAWLLQAAREHLHKPGGPFNTSVEELGRDRAGLDPKD